jgi:hypothetical protein
MQYAEEISEGGIGENQRDRDSGRGDLGRWLFLPMLAEERVVETEGKHRDRERGAGQVVISAHVG